MDDIAGYSLFGGYRFYCLYPYYRRFNKKVPVGVRKWFCITELMFDDARRKLSGTRSEFEAYGFIKTYDG
ncbi:unnamed protein product [Sphenostylis stenocarpa]|uniref:Uncharacterized protein n=1 Tax=Sphenostylis stenocarpa TaxID=92480 RepID=A0AA86SZF6_9FABA|nr:unnamed protein product [Sphenostylis stenocarpa]